MTHADEFIRRVAGDKANCLNARMGTGGNPVQLVAFGIGRDAFNQGTNAKFNPTIEAELQPSLTARGTGAIAKGVVRRLTPLECERLMGTMTINGKAITIGKSNKVLTQQDVIKTFMTTRTNMVLLPPKQHSTKPSVPPPKGKYKTIDEAINAMVNDCKYCRKRQRILEKLLRYQAR